MNRTVPWPVFALVTILGLGIAAGLIATAESSAVVNEQQPQSNRRTQFRDKLLEYYDLSGALMDTDKMLAPGVDKDGIPAITDPIQVPVTEARYPSQDDWRVVEVVVNGKAAAYPLRILNYHEIINDTLGGVPIAVTYCPLCDSVSVFDRRMPADTEDAEPRVLEFGVSGLLFNSNVVMYERGTMGLWSQVAMKALSGPDVGSSLTHLPVRVVSYGMYKRRHPGGTVMSDKTGYEDSRDYSINPYQRYFDSPDRVFHTFEYDDRLPPKALGMGIVAGDESFFVRADAAFKSPVTVETSAGTIVVIGDEAGVRIETLPEGVRALQTYYHSWDAFHPGSTIVPALDNDGDGHDHDDHDGDESHEGHDDDG